MDFKQMRICHLFAGTGTIRFGLYACSPEDSSFTARFTGMDLGDCKWLPPRRPAARRGGLTD